MKLDPWGRLRDARYALPGRVEKIVRGPGPDAAARACARLHRKGLAATVGYFQAGDGARHDIVSANRAVAARLATRSGDAYLSVKAPPLEFDMSSLRNLAEAAADAGMTLMFDAHAPRDAERTLDVVSSLLPDFPGTGCVLPARWLRSARDAARFRDTTARIRIVKGEWADPEWGERDIEAHYLGLVSGLAGRTATVAVATHAPSLAERALTTLIAAGTPCELEQLRGLPRRRTVSVARRLGVPVRVYVPFGPGWWPYAIDKALARPYLIGWAIRDLLGSLSGAGHGATGLAAR